MFANVFQADNYFRGRDYMFISTKKVMLSTVSVCLFVFLSVYVNILPVLINYRLNLYEILRKYLDLILTDLDPLCIESFPHLQTCSTQG